MRALGALVAALLVILAACEDEEEELAPSPSPSAEASARQSASPTPEPTPSALDSETVERYRVIFVRHASLSYPEPAGDLWIGNLDGSAQRRLIDDGEVVAYAGVGPNLETDQAAVYYVRFDGEKARSVWAADLLSSKRWRIVQFESRRDDAAAAAVSPDGRHLAFAHAGGIDLLDIGTGERRALLHNGPEECDARTCFGYSLPQWSADGRLLLVRKTFWEGGTTVIFDPFGANIQLFTNDSPEGPFAARWSQFGPTICAHGHYGGPSSLFLAEGPDWLFVNVLPQYEMFRPDTRLVASCVWIDRERVAFAVNVARPDDDGDVIPENSVELLVFDLPTGEERLVAEFPGPVQIWTGHVLALIGMPIIITQQLVDDDGNGSGVPSRPELFHIHTNQRTPVLEAGDWIVDVIEP